MVYKCEICGKEYNSISAAQACEEKCEELKKAEIEAKEKAELELKEDEDELNLLLKNLTKAKLNVVECEKEIDKKKRELFEKYPNSTIGYCSVTENGNDGEVTACIVPIKEYNGFKDIYDDVSKLFNNDNLDFPKFKNYWF